MGNRKKPAKKTSAEVLTTLSVVAALLTAATHAVELLEAIKHFLK